MVFRSKERADPTRGRGWAMGRTPKIVYKSEYNLGGLSIGRSTGASTIGDHVVVDRVTGSMPNAGLQRARSAPRRRHQYHCLRAHESTVWHQLVSTGWRTR